MLRAVKHILWVLYFLIVIILTFTVTALEVLFIYLYYN